MKEAAKTRAATALKSAKRPYIKPAFRSERVFETMALACGKTSSTEGQCHIVIKRS
jgi:hypothetical protein